MKFSGFESDGPRAWSNSTRKGRRARLTAVVILLVVFSLYRWPWKRRGSLSQETHVSDVYNRTLGFQRNFVVSMPGRSDRQDRFSLAASFADFEFEFIDGIKGSDMSHQAYPANWFSRGHIPGEIGCWRAHLNVLQKIVREKIQTALIFEDDADFDVTLKQQLEMFSRGVRALQPPSSEPLRTPFGNQWDLLWPGTCVTGSNNHNKTQIYVIQNDPTVPPVKKRHGLFMDEHLGEEPLSDTTRMIFKTQHYSFCLAGYAVTYEGARKALAVMSLEPQNEAVDQIYRYLCGSEISMPFDCYSMYPPMVGVHRPAGPSSRDSEIRDWDDSWHKEYTFDVVYSMKQNMARLARGETTVLAQWPLDVRHPTREISQKLVTGKEFIIDNDPSVIPWRRVDGVNAWGMDGLEWEHGPSD